MSDDPQRINLDEFRDRKPRASKSRSKGGEPVDDDPRADAREAASKVADSNHLDGKSIEELSELAIRRMANVVLRGGEDFLPTTLKEASDSAKTWASVASMEAARKAGKGSGQAEDDPVVAAVLSDLQKFNKEKGRPVR